MSSYLLDLSNAPGEGNELADMDVPSGHPSSRDYESIRVLNVAHSHLLSLETAPGSTLQDLVHRVTTLQVPFNNLDSLAGIEHFVSLEVLNLSHNEFTVIDANVAAPLHRLESLQVIDLSHNNLRLLDLEMPAAKAVPIGGASVLHRPSLSAGEGHTLGVISLNLSHNSLIELPDLRVMPALQVLNLDDNGIEDISDIDTRLPLLTIHTLQIRENRLPTASHAMPLAALANTVRHLHIYGNPFTLASDEEEVLMSAQPSRVNASRLASVIPSARNNGANTNPWWWRPYLLWLLPLAQTLDATPFTASERAVAAALFRERGVLSKGCIELLNSNRRDDLDAYLRKHGERATPPADVLAAVLSLQEEEEEEEEGSGARYNVETPARLSTSRTTTAAGALAAVPAARPTSAQPRGADREVYQPLNNSEWFQPSATVAPATQVGSGSQRRGSQTRASDGGGGAAAPTANDVLAAIQFKLRSLAAVVETLWQHDIARRTFAAVAIQKWYRGYAVRRDLPDDVRESVEFIRQQLQLPGGVGAGVGGTAARVTSRSAAPRGVPASRVSGEMAKATAPVVATGNQAADIQEVLSTMKGLQSVMTTMWEDLDEYRAMAEREQRRAAVTIQRHYRGYRGRKEWRQLKSGYDEFVDSLAPFVRVIQRVGRGYRAREVIRADAHRSYEVRRLRTEVAGLRDELRQIRAALGLPEKSDATPSRSAAHPPQPATFAAWSTDSGLEDPLHRRSAPAVERSQSATASVLHDALEDDSRLSHNTPPAADECPVEEAEPSPTRAAVFHRRPQGSAPLRPGGTGRGVGPDTSVATSDGGSEGEGRPRFSDKRIMKRRPSRGSSAEETPRSAPRKPPPHREEGGRSSGSDENEAQL